MKWVIFEYAVQAAPGSKMRPLHKVKMVGRQKELRVSCREQDTQLGNIIRFTNGSYLRIKDAKRQYEVTENLAK